MWEVKAGGERNHQMAEWNTLESFMCAVEEGESPGGDGELGLPACLGAFRRLPHREPPCAM